MSGLPHSREELLGLFADYVGEEYVEDVVKQLGEVRRDGFRIPDKVLIVLFASRSGSNYLGQLLSSTGWFREIGESFAPHQLKKIRERYGLADVHDAAQWMIDNRGTPEAFGFKAGFAVLLAAAELGVLPELIDRAQLILLRRRDRVAQAISLVKSQLTGRTHSGQQLKVEVSDRDYDADAIAFQHWLIGERDAQFADLAAKLEKQAPTFYYEDICAAPLEHVTRACDLLGLEVPADYRPNVRVEILRDDLSARWAERFRSERGVAA